MGKTRMEAFTDGIFAIVVTLIVLELRIPHDTGNIWEGLKHIMPTILTYAFSFIIIALYWTAHHSMFHYIKSVDRNLLWLNNLFLLTMGFLPFPNAVFGAHPTDPTAATLYLGTLALSNATGALSWWYAGHAGLMDPNLPMKIHRFILKMHLTPVAVYGAAAALIPVAPKVSYALMVLVPAFFILPNPWLNKKLSGG